jgi:hypothetical protein
MEETTLRALFGSFGRMGSRSDAAAATELVCSVPVDYLYSPASHRKKVFIHPTIHLTETLEGHPFWRGNSFSHFDRVAVPASEMTKVVLAQDGQF